MDFKLVIKNHGWTITRIAEAMGVTQGAISNMIKGNPTLDKLQEMATILGITASQLLAEAEGLDVSSAITRCPYCGKPVVIHVTTPFGINL